MEGNQRDKLEDQQNRCTLFAGNSKSQILYLEVMEGRERSKTEGQMVGRCRAVPADGGVGGSLVAGQAGPGARMHVPFLLGGFERQASTQLRD